MRSPWLVLTLAFCAAIAFVALRPSGAEQTAKKPTNEEQPSSKITPVVMLKPGEKKELLLSTWCRVGVTRGGGLSVGVMEKGRVQYQSEFGWQKSKVWKRDGLTLEVPDFGEAEKVAAQPVYAPLKEKGLNAFVVKVTAAKDAKPGLLNVHVADSTCSGNCDTDFRVLVVAPDNH